MTNSVMWCSIEDRMIGKQSKNTIKVITAVMLSVIFGEGVMGWGVYWPFLLLLLDFPGVYWLSFVVGIFVSVFRGIPVGLPSVFLLVVVGVMSILMSPRRELGILILVVAVVANLVFDKVFGFGSSIWEVLAVIVCGFAGMRWFEKSETIRINY